MRWNALGSLVIFLGIVSWCQSIETQDHAPSSDKTYHFPTASLTIAGDLKDVKLKGTIAQLVRALQQPNTSAAAVKAKETPEPKPKTTHYSSSGTKKIIHPSQLITKHNLFKNGKKLYYGDPKPDSITVSSQSVKVSQTNGTGDKKSRHLQAFIGNHPSLVRTIEGVRVPDDEADKHYTWRQARVIKGFLVPNGKPANPHKKRQVIITDPQQYLAAAAAAQAQGASTIFDASGVHGNSNNGQPRTSVFYAQEQAHQGLSSGSGAGSSNNGASNFAIDPTQQRSHPHVAYPNQQQAHQQLSALHQTTNNGQTSAYSYTPQQNAQMYVLQDGNAYNMQQYQAAAPSSSSSTHHQAQLVQQQSQSQFYSRSGEASTAPAGSQNSQQQQQQGSANANSNTVRTSQQQQQPLSAAIKQQYQPSLDTQAIQAAVEAVQQLEAQQAAAAAVTGSGANNQQAHSAQQQQSQSQIQTAQQVPLQGHLQAQQIQLGQASSPSQTVVLPQSAGGATAQEILAAAAAASNGQVTAQYIQIQPSQEQPLLQLQQQQSAQQQYPAPNQFAERQTYPGSGATTAYATGSATQTYVIQPQTYVTGGGGGPTFTVPIPVPVETSVLTQQQGHQQQQQQHSHQQHQQQQGRHQVYNNHHNNQHQQHQFQGNNNGNNRHSQHQQGQNLNQQSSIGDRMKQVFNQNFNRKMLERVETNAVVPALASTGLFLGLSALAAGWYLSKNNREVGIVRRTGKFSKKSGSPAPSSANSIAPAAPEVKDKENVANPRTRRDLASMVTPQAYNPSGAPEVDQATFFQSIIQQSLEKTQKEYEDQPVDQPVYNQDNYDNGPMPYHRGDTEPERHGPPSPPMPPPPQRQRSKFSRYNDRPSKYSRDDDYYETPAHSRISKSQQIQEKSGWSVHSAKNFARVAIPAIVLTGAALGICAVIFGWYISGDNREIAFLESPTTNHIGHNSRRKRSLFGSNSPSSSATWSDGWLIRTLKAIHGNPYDNMPAPTAKSFVPYPYFLEKDSSKTSAMEFKVSNNGLAGVLAGGAVLAVVALGLINSFSESSGRNLKTARYNHLLTPSANQAAYTNSNSKSSTNPLTHLRAPRNMAAHFDNDLELQQAASNPSFFESIVSSLEASGDTIMTKLHEFGSSNWQVSPCTKRIVCQAIASQGDDTVRIMEKKMASVMKMLPDSVSSSINKNYNDLLASIYKRDCSSFTCSSHKKHDTPAPVHIRNITPSTSSHLQQSSIKIDQTVTNNSR